MVPEAKINTQSMEERSMEKTHFSSFIFLNSCDYILVIQPSGRIFLWTGKPPVFNNSEIKSSQLLLMAVYILKDRQLELSALH